MPSSETCHHITNTVDLMKLRHRARGFSFLPKQPVHSLLSGKHSSRLRGRGLNFEELRHYRSGDDIRTMDWKVTNRTKKPHVRVYTEERERPVLLLVDQRVSMFFGSQVKMKSVTAVEIAALAAWRVLDASDRVGALIFGDDSIIEIRPERSKKTVMRILAELERANKALLEINRPKSNQPQLNLVLKKTEQLCKHDTLIILISDFDGWNEESVKRVKRLSRHNDLIASYVFDPLEKTLPESQSLVVSDGSMQLEVKPREQDLGKKFAEAFDSNVSSIEQELKKHRIPVIPIQTVDPVHEQLRKAIGAVRR
ncbi:MAG: DUF58 domain-containing protein [Opitutaceae bacterium]|nr:DUF58 domain-containing protein [Opitutaceae bacterium]